MKSSKLKAVLIAASVLVSFGNANAQKGFQIGVEGTPQLSYLVNKSDMESDLYTAEHAGNGSFGISTQLGFTENIGVGVNVLYSFQGDKYEWKDVLRYKQLQYIKVPIMVTLSYPFGSDMMFIGKIGPQIDFLTDAKLLDSDREAILDDYSEAFEMYALSAVVSAGVGYNIGSNLCLDVAIRYDAGLTDAEDKDYTSNVHYPFDVVTPAPASSPRGITSNMTVGLTVGLRYTFM